MGLWRTPLATPGVWHVASLDSWYFWRSGIRVLVAPYSARVPIAFFSDSMSLLPLTIATWAPVLVMPLLLLLLGASLREARVREAHIWRGFVYSVPAVACLTLVLMALLTVTPAGLQYLPSRPVRWFAWSIPLWVVAFHVWWWRWYIGRYLRLRHAGVIAGALVSACTLLVLNVLLWGRLEGWL